jgi:NNP family nitrate/nitrite transporter-like MFS transporter
MGAMASTRSNLVLLATALAFIVTFAVWMMFGVTGIPIREQLDLNATQFGLLTATPVLTGSLLRLPFGIWTDRFGGRVMMSLLLIVSAVPVWLSSYADRLWQFLLLGLARGLVGAAVSVGTPYVARFFSKEHRGFAMGIFGAGTSGAALNMFVAPQLIDAYGWQMVPRVYAIALLVTAVLFWLLSAPDPGLGGKRPPSMRSQLGVLRDPRVWRYCQYYSIVFGGFTALSIWLPRYFVNEYSLSITMASLLAAGFALPGGLFRALGGWLSDRFGPQSVTWSVLWVSWVCLFLLSYPQTELIIHTIHGPKQFAITPPIWVYIALLFVLGIVFAFGMASTFKHLGDDFPDSLGAVSGIVGMVGGLGGFLLPIMFGAILDWIAISSSCFMLMYGIVSVSLALYYLTEIRRYPLLGEDADEIRRPDMPG